MLDVTITYSEFLFLCKPWSAAVYFGGKVGGKGKSKREWDGWIMDG